MVERDGGRPSQWSSDKRDVEGRIDYESNLAGESFDGEYFADCRHRWEREEVPSYHPVQWDGAEGLLRGVSDPG